MIKEPTRSARSPRGRYHDQDLFWDFRGFRDDEKGVCVNRVIREEREWGIKLRC